MLTLFVALVYLRLQLKGMSPYQDVMAEATKELNSLWLSWADAYRIGSPEGIVASTALITSCRIKTGQKVDEIFALQFAFAKSAQHRTFTRDEYVSVLKNLWETPQFVIGMVSKESN